MSKKEKLMARLLSKPKDFTFEELIVLLGCLGYTEVNIGKTSGSRVTIFIIRTILVALNFQKKTKFFMEN